MTFFFCFDLLDYLDISVLVYNLLSIHYEGIDNYSERNTCTKIQTTNSALLSLGQRSSENISIREHYPKLCYV